MEFAAAVYELSKLPERRYAEEPLYIAGEAEETRFKMEIFGKTFRWGSGLGEFEKVRNIVERLVSAL